MDTAPSQTVLQNATEQVNWLIHLIWTLLGFVGAGIGVGIRMSRGENLNAWAIGTTLVAGMAAAGVCTQAFVSFLGVNYVGLAGGIALFLGLMAIGFANNAVDGKIPFINKIFGGTKDGQ